MARNALFAIALVAALGLGGCSGSEDEAAAEAAAQAQLAALRAKNDSLRAARAAATADSAVAADTARSTLAATTPASDTMTMAEAQTLLADSIRRAREIEVMREAFAYGGGTRDPFVSLMNLSSAGPEFGELELVGVYQDLRSRDNSVIVLREKVTTKRHKLRVGDRVGRARLTQIRPRDAVFMISDFGYERQETLSLRKQEVETP